MDEFFDLTDSSNDIDSLGITQKDQFECVLVNTQTGTNLKGFILSRSSNGNVATICETNFQKSGTDDKFQPRLVFRKVDPNLNDLHARADVDHIRIPFKTGSDGYRQFWKMIFFLYGFKEMIDFGDFDGSYHILTREELTQALNDHDNLERIKEAVGDLELGSAGVLKSAATLKILKSYREKLNSFIEDGASETSVQSWIDEGNHKLRRQRCLIFGLEFVDFKREGQVSSKKFDILTKIGPDNLERVLIELKGANSNFFDIANSETINNTTTEYNLHSDLARAIPQILEYKDDLNSKQAGDPDLERLGITSGTANVQKCIIVIGKNNNDSRWIKNRNNLRNSLSSSLEIWTYSDLLHKLDATIENLEADILPE